MVGDQKYGPVKVGSAVSLGKRMLEETKILKLGIECMSFCIET